MAAELTLPGGHKVPRKALIVVGGGAAAYVAYRYVKGGAPAPATTGVDATDPGADSFAGGYGSGSFGAGGGYGGGGGISGGLPTTDYSSLTADPLAAAPTTNTEWAQRALAYAVSIGYDPQAASEAIGRYLAGGGVAGDTALITGVLGQAGTPPTGQYTFPSITPTPATPPTAGQPATTPGTTPPAPTPASSAANPANTAFNYGWFTSQSKNNTVENVAKAEGLRVDQLLALNPGLKAGSKITPGTVVQIRSNVNPYVAVAKK